MLNGRTWSLVVLGLVLMGCPRAYVDDDHAYLLGRQVILDMEVQDSLDVRAGDVVDWKVVVPMGDGGVRLGVVVGDPFKGSHALVGSIDIFNADKERLSSVRVRPEQTQYTLKWDATSDVRYFMRLSAQSGQASYRITYRQKVAVDPCASCADDQTCQSGRCITVVAETPCGGTCTGRKTCDVRTNRCVRRNPCKGVVCGGGKVCRGGVCRSRTRASAPVGCTPACSRRETCKRHRCVPKKAQVAPSGGTIVKHNAQLVDRIPMGSKTALILSKGRAHGVKQGDKGTVGGFSFRVIAVYGTRCKVVVNAPMSKLAGKTRATIISKP